jgi:hypothetical protein
MSIKPNTHHRVVLRDVRARLNDHIYVSYLNYSFFIKGAVVAAAALGLIFILGTTRLEFKWVRLVLWIASLGFSLVTVATWNRGSAFTGSRANYFDLILPVLMGVAEVSMYVLIAPTLPDAPNDLWVYWYAALSAHCFLAVALIWNRQTLTHASDYSHELQGILAEFETWIATDKRGAFILGLASAAVFVLTKVRYELPFVTVPFDSAATAWVHGLLGCAAFALSVHISLSAMRQYKVLSEL